MLIRLDRLTVLVRNLDEATSRYAELLAREPAWRGEREDLHARDALFRLENGDLELVSPAPDANGSSPLSLRLERQGEGLLRVSFVTDDAAECAQELCDAGIPAALEEREETSRETDGSRVRRWRRARLPEDATRGVSLEAVELLDGSADDLVSPAGKAPVTRFDHVVVRGEDMDASRDLYRDRLGLRLALDRTFPDRRVRLLFFRIGGVTVELAGPDVPPDEPAARDQLWGVAYRVDDVGAVRDRAVKAGFDVTDVRTGNKPGTRVCTVRDGTCDVPTLLIGD